MKEMAFPHVSLFIKFAVSSTVPPAFSSVLNFFSEEEVPVTYTVAPALPSSIAIPLPIPRDAPV